MNNCDTCGSPEVVIRAIDIAWSDKNGRKVYRPIGLPKRGCALHPVESVDRGCIPEDPK